MNWSQNLTTFNHANVMSLRARLPRFVAYTKRTTNQSENSVSLTTCGRFSLWRARSVPDGIDLRKKCFLAYIYVIRLFGKSLHARITEKKKKTEKGPNFATFIVRSFTYNGILPFVNYARRYYNNCCTKLRKCECDYTDLM